MIRVIIERKVKRGKEREMWALLHDLRSKAIRQPGYVSGETLVGHDNPLLWVVIGTWLKAENWRYWLNSPERKAIVGEEKSLVVAPAKITVLKFLEEAKGDKIEEEQEEEEELEQK